MAIFVERLVRDLTSLIVSVKFKRIYFAEKESQKSGSFVNRVILTRLETKFSTSSIQIGGQKVP